MLGSLRQMSVFRTVARHESFTRAAEELYISQPAVSAPVRELQRLYGVEVVPRIGDTHQALGMVWGGEVALAVVALARRALD